MVRTSFKLELLWDISERRFSLSNMGISVGFQRAHNEPVASLKLNLVTAPTWAPQTQSYNSPPVRLTQQSLSSPSSSRRPNAAHHVRRHLCIHGLASKSTDRSDRPASSFHKSHRASRLIEARLYDLFACSDWPPPRESGDFRL